MADAVSGSVTAPIPSFYIGSPDDAVNVMDAVQVTLTDNIRNGIQQNVSAASRLVDILYKISGAAVAVFNGLTITPTPVTVAKLESTPKTTTDLQALFVADGPMLGANLQQANDTVDLLTSLGVTVNAPVITPVLVEVDNKDGSPPTKTFAWYSEAQLTDVHKLTDTQTSPYPGITTYVKTTVNGSGKVTQTINYTTFDNYANRRTTTDVSFNVLLLLITLATAIQVELAAELANAAKKADKLEDVVDDNRNAVKDEQTTQSQRRTERDDQLAEALRQLRVLKAEREELRTRARTKLGETGAANGDAGRDANAQADHGLHLGQVVSEAARAIREGRPFQLGEAFPGKGQTDTDRRRA